MGERLDGLDALRGVAALCVLLSHITMTKPWFATGGVAVDLFFVISGFVMAHTFEPITHPIKFLAKRIARLWPMLALGTSIGFASAIIAGSAYLPTYLLNLLFLPGQGGAFPYNGPMWSLFFELLLNVIHAFALWRMRFSQLALVVVLSASVYGLTLIHDGEPPVSISLATLARATIGYVIGILLYRSGCKGMLHPLIALFALPSLILAGRYVPSSLFYISFVAAAAPLLTLMCAKAVNSPTFSFLGLLSYPLYATHIPALILSIALGLSAIQAFAMIVLCTALGIGIEGLRSKVRPRQLAIS